MVEDKTNTMEVHRDLSIESKLVLLPEVNKWIIIQIFLPRRQQHTPFLMKGTTGDTLLQCSLHLHLTIQWPVTLLADQSYNWQRNQSHSLDFILVGQQSQMDAYREMTCSNQAREDDALFCRY